MTNTDEQYLSTLLRAFGIVDTNMIQNIISPGCDHWEFQRFIEINIDGQEHAFDAFASPLDLTLIGFSEDVSKFLFDRVFSNIDHDYFITLEYVAKMYIVASISTCFFAQQP